MKIPHQRVKNGHLGSISPHMVMNIAEMFYTLRNRVRQGGESVPNFVGFSGSSGMKIPCSAPKNKRTVSLMSLFPQSVPPIPADTARIAHAAFPKGTLTIRAREALGSISTADAFTDLFATNGQPALAPWRHALVLVLQFVEGLSDWQAADAVRGRIDWTYALSETTTKRGLAQSNAVSPSGCRCRLRLGPLHFSIPPTERGLQIIIEHLYPHV